MKLGSLFVLLEDVERHSISTGQPVDPALRQAYDEVKREAEACLKAALERPTTDEIMTQHRHERRKFIVLMAVFLSLSALAYAGIVLGWVR